MTTKFGVAIVFTKEQMCVKLHCPTSAATLFSEDGEGEPLFPVQGKAKESS